MFLEKDEMKFAILYTLKVYSYPLPLEKLTELLTWDEEVMSYFDLSIMLSELIEDGFIQKLRYREAECVRLTEKGSDANEFFSGRVPRTIRKNIKEYAQRDEFDEKTNPNGTVCDIEPVSYNRYFASLTMLDSGSPILELKVDAGSRAEANRAKELLRKNADDIYKYIFKTLDGNKED
ncbi:MAG TPA: DUF4364 family protein [Candidatus Monoglobus merdigallinarum]|uniref:DUF4364 family protein n=1 Tax=Candidatus Monoglobus merdigallinarum TaxID=2838698 RepID=A0A9D1PQ59_9FIRM|nr:DUF4364 family protein [Candidatus Monoglobus merdigallinarum]